MGIEPSDRSNTRIGGKRFAKRPPQKSRVNRLGAFADTQYVTDPLPRFLERNGRRCASRGFKTKRIERRKRTELRTEVTDRNHVVGIFLVYVFAVRKLLLRRCGGLPELARIQRLHKVTFPAVVGRRPQDLWSRRNSNSCLPPDVRVLPTAFVVGEGEEERRRQ